MTRALPEAHRQAVDLLLDRATVARAAETFAPVSGTSDPYVRSVQSVLLLLDHLPAPEPSSDLVSRTLSRVRGASPSSTIQETLNQAIATQHPA